MHTRMTDSPFLFKLHYTELMHRGVRRPSDHSQTVVASGICPLKEREEHMHVHCRQESCMYYVISRYVTVCVERKHAGAHKQYTAHNLYYHPPNSPQVEQSKNLNKEEIEQNNSYTNRPGCSVSSHEYPHSPYF